jgi:hypothetical protein
MKIWAPKRAVIISVATALLAGGGVTAIAQQVTNTVTANTWTGLRAGVGVVDATWHVGSGAGQYASDNIPDPNDPLHAEWDPNFQHVKQKSSYGVASRLSIRALVLKDGVATDPPIAIVKIDNYLAQDMLQRRIAQILSDDGSPVTYDNLMVSVTHDHNSPYYSSPAAGVWLFQDVADLRMFEYQARQAASAIEIATKNMVPARVGATTVQSDIFQGNIAGSDRNEDGSPTGYSEWDNDHGVVVMRFDNMSDPNDPTPLATYVNYAEHGESLDGYDLISADWLAPFQRYVDGATGVPVVYSQGAVGSSEGPYDYTNGGASTPDAPHGQPRQSLDGGQAVNDTWGHTGFAQAERGTHLLADCVIAAWDAIGHSDPSHGNNPEADKHTCNTGDNTQKPLNFEQIPVTVGYESNIPVKMITHWVAGPISHPYPSVGNCRTGPTGQGDVGVPAAGLPDCERLGSDSGLTPLPFTVPVVDALKAAGVPVPDNYDASSFGTVEENLRIKLQAVRIGDTLLASCSCEAQADLIRDIETRTDTIAVPFTKDAPHGNIWTGIDYSNQDEVNESWPADIVGHPVQACFLKNATTESCPNTEDRWGNSRDEMPVSVYQHMEAEINNDANGWNDPANAAQANSEPADTTKIWGNYTHTELGANHDGQDYSKCAGYPMTVGLGHTGDYDGYNVSYREYMARDAYRKALTSYGAHTGDYMATELVSMAAALEGCGNVLAQTTDPIAAVDEQRQNAEAIALGQISSAYYDAWTAQIPDSAGDPTKPVTQPAAQVQRFDDASFTWVGGDDWTDNPTVTVQKLDEHGNWQPYADQSGEVITTLAPPADAVTGTPNYYAGAEQWNWTATFEAFDSYPKVDVPGGQVQNGTYKFVVNGLIHQGGKPTAYHVDSSPFQVVPWTGITASDVQIGANNVSFTVKDNYPEMPQHKGGLSAFYAPNPPPGANHHHDHCASCHFRPWASSGQVTSAEVELVDPSGAVTDTQPASYDIETGRWVASLTVPSGWSVTIPRAGIRDEYGEVNGEALTAQAA